MFSKRSILPSICAIAFASIFLNVQAANLFTVTNTLDSGAGSLRQALVDANSSSGAVTIAFNIPKTDAGYELNTAGVWTIRPLTTLPALTGGAITIDGSTQKTNQGDTNSGGPEVEIDGGNLGSTATDSSGNTSEFSAPQAGACLWLYLPLMLNKIH